MSNPIMYGLEVGNKIVNRHGVMMIVTSGDRYSITGIFIRHPGLQFLGRSYTINYGEDCSWALVDHDINLSNPIIKHGELLRGSIEGGDGVMDLMATGISHEGVVKCVDLNSGIIHTIPVRRVSPISELPIWRIKK